MSVRPVLSAESAQWLQAMADSVPMPPSYALAAIIKQAWDRHQATGSFLTAVEPSNPGKSKAASQPKETVAERKERTAREEAERKAKRIPWGRECNRIMEYAELPDHIRPRVRFNPQYEYEVAEGGHKYRQMRFDVIDPNDQEASDWLVRRHRHPNATTAGHPYPTQLDHLSAGELLARFGVTPENKREIPLDLLKVDGGYGRPTCTWTPIELPDPVRFGLDARASIEVATNEYRQEPTVVEGWRTFKAVRVTREPAPGEDYVSYDTFLAQHGPYPESEAFEAAHGAPHFPGENG